MPILNITAFHNVTLQMSVLIMLDFCLKGFFHCILAIFEDTNTMYIFLCIKVSLNIARIYEQLFISYAFIVVGSLGVYQNFSAEWKFY